MENIQNHKKLSESDSDSELKNIKIHHQSSSSSNNTKHIIFAILSIIILLFLSTILVFVTKEKLICRIPTPYKQQENSARVYYWVWSGPNPDNNTTKKSRLSFDIIEKSSLYHVMDEAQTFSPETFKFEYKEYPFGKLITSVGGIKENPTENLYWFIYQLSSEPDPKNPPTEQYMTSVGIDDLKTLHQDIFLLWLTYYNSNDMSSVYYKNQFSNMQEKRIY